MDGQAGIVWGEPVTGVSFLSGRKEGGCFEERVASTVCAGAVSVGFRHVDKTIDFTCNEKVSSAKKLPKSERNWTLTVLRRSRPWMAQAFSTFWHVSRASQRPQEGGSIVFVFLLPPLACGFSVSNRNVFLL